MMPCNLVHTRQQELNAEDFKKSLARSDVSDQLTS
jgi:hypothetical protein